MRWNLLVFSLCAAAALDLILQGESMELSLLAWLGGWFACEIWNGKR